MEKTVKTKRQRVIELYEADKSVPEITKELGMNHSNNVYTIIRQYKMAEELKSLKVKK